MSIVGLYLCDIKQLADKLAREFASLPFEKFAEDIQKIESAVVRLAIMREGCSSLPDAIQESLVQIDWPAVIGKWDWQARRHVDIDQKELWETILRKLPEMSRNVQELLKTRV